MNVLIDINSHDSNDISIVQSIVVANNVDIGVRDHWFFEVGVLLLSLFS